MIEITEAIATKVRDLVDQGLVEGLGNPKPGEMCVEAAVCFALGLPHGDDPGCVAPTLRHLKIRLNDSAWSSPMARAKGLRRLAVAQLGSKGVLDDKEFSRRVIDLTIRRSVASALRSAAKLNPKYSAALEIVALRCENDGTREAALEAKSVARTVRDAAAAAAADAAYAYAYAYAAAAAADAAYAAAAADADARVIETKAHAAKLLELLRAAPVRS